MLLPDKHIKVAESLLGLGGFVLQKLKTPQSVDELWVSFLKAYQTKQFPVYHSFDNLILAIDFLYLIGAIIEDEQGRLIKCT